MFSPFQSHLGQPSPSNTTRTVRQRNRENARNASSREKDLCPSAHLFETTAGHCIMWRHSCSDFSSPLAQKQCSPEPPSIICCVGVFKFFLKFALYIRRCVFCSFPGHPLFVCLVLVRAYKKWVTHRWCDVISSNDSWQRVTFVNFCHTSRVLQKCTGLRCKWESLNIHGTKKRINAGSGWAWAASQLLWVSRACARCCLFMCRQ